MKINNRILAGAAALALGALAAGPALAQQDASAGPQLNGSTWNTWRVGPPGSNTLSYSGTVNLTGTSNITGNETVTGTHTVGASTVTGDQTVAGAQTVAGTTTFQGATQAFRIHSTNGFFHGSDRTLKDNIRDLGKPTGAEKDGPAIIAGLKGYRWTWKEGGRADMGIMAQDVQAVAPELVQAGPNGKLTVNDSGLVAALIDTVNQQAARLAELEKRLDAAGAEIASLKAANAPGVKVGGNAALPH